jgi:hypothetical protein
MDEKLEKAVTDPSAWGGCPFPWCHKNDGFICVKGYLGMKIWFYCITHKIRWLIGVDLREFAGAEVLSQADLADFMDFQKAPPWFKV